MAINLDVMRLERGVGVNVGNGEQMECVYGLDMIGIDDSRPNW